MKFINLIKGFFFKPKSEELRFAFFRIIASLSPIGLVFLTRIFLNEIDFNKYQTDYTLILFGSSIFSFGIGVVSQIIGAQYSQMKNWVIFLSSIILFFVSALNALFHSLFVYVLPFSSEDKLIVYLWPTYIILNIIPNYYLGRKKYLNFFLPTILSSITLILGLIFYVFFNSKKYLFLFFFFYNICYFLYYFFSFLKNGVDFKKLSTVNEILKKQLIPFYSSMIGIKNFQYYIIQIFGNSIFGDVKLLVTSFNSINFFTTNKITVFSNNLLKDKASKIPKSKYQSAINYIIFLNCIFSFIFYFATFFFNDKLNYSFLEIFLFCLFNIGFNISNLNNQLLFAIQNSKFRVFGDFIIVGIISLYSLFLFIQKITYNLNNAIILLVMSVWFVFLFNYFIKKKFDLFDVLKVNNT